MEEWELLMIIKQDLMTFDEIELYHQGQYIKHLIRSMRGLLLKKITTKK